MEINIIEEDLLCNIQQEFRRQYPYLKLQFYKSPHKAGEASPEKDRLNALLPIEEVTMFHTGGRIDISPERTVAEVEEDFFRQTGLCVQVMRQSGTLWLVTTDTDDLTLVAQNEKGREHSQPLSRDKEEDFDLQDVD